MDIITDGDKAPNNIHYSVTNSSGSVLKKFGKGQKAAYDYAQSMNETAIIRGCYIFKYRGEWCTRTVFMDHIFR